MAEIVLHKILNFNIEFPAKISETGINISIRNFLINSIDNQGAVSFVSLLFKINSSKLEVLMTGVNSFFIFYRSRSLL